MTFFKSSSGFLKNLNNIIKYSKFGIAVESNPNYLSPNYFSDSVF